MPISYACHDPDYHDVCSGYCPPFDTYSCDCKCHVDPDMAARVELKARKRDSE